MRATTQRLATQLVLECARTQCSALAIVVTDARVEQTSTLTYTSDGSLFGDAVGLTGDQAGHVSSMTCAVWVVCIGMTDKVVSDLDRSVA